MKKGFEALIPGGEYHVEGETVSDEKDGMAKRLKAVGFVNPEVRRVIPDYTGLLAATKPQS